VLPYEAVRLPPTSPELLDDAARPYFLWWTDLTVGGLKEKLQSTEGDADYFFGALLREANTRDVWLFTTPAEVRRRWPRVARYLGRARRMWAFLLGVDDDPPRRP
jgi:hypothetical protein